MGSNTSSSKKGRSQYSWTSTASDSGNDFAVVGLGKMLDGVGFDSAYRACPEEQPKQQCPPESSLDLEYLPKLVHRMSPISSSSSYASVVNGNSKSAASSLNSTMYSTPNASTLSTPCFGSVNDVGLEAEVAHAIDQRPRSQSCSLRSWVPPDRIASMSASKKRSQLDHTTVPVMGKKTETVRSAHDLPDLIHTLIDQNSFFGFRNSDLGSASDTSLTTTPNVSATTSPFFGSSDDIRLGDSQFTNEVWNSLGAEKASLTLTGETDKTPQISFTPENFIIYPSHPFHFVNEYMKFYIEVTHGFILQKPYFFSIKLKLPSGGDLVELQLRRDDEHHSDRYFCSYFANQLGRYVLYITLTSSNKINVTGSPYEIFVTRNYKIYQAFNLARVGFIPSENISSGLQLSKPWGISFHRLYNLIFVADRNVHAILVLDMSGNVRFHFGSEGHGPGQLYRPTGVAVDAMNRRVYVTDKDNHRVSVFGILGSYITSFGSQGHGNGQFSYPWGIAVSPDGNFVAVADSRNHRIQLFDKYGSFLKKYTVYETNPFEYKTKFDYPRGIAFNRSGTQIYVTDFNTHELSMFDLGLTTRTVLIKNLARPQGLAVDEAGNILVTDSKNNCIQVYLSNGSPVATIDGTGNDGFRLPMDICVLSGGRLAVTDSDCRFRIF